jgi:hypothetical protein
LLSTVGMWSTHPSKRVLDAQRKAPVVASPAKRVLYAASLVALGALLNHRLREPAQPASRAVRVEHVPCTQSAATSRRATESKTAPLSDSSTPLATVSGDRMRERSREFLGHVGQRLSLIEETSPSQRPEDMIARMHEYVLGWSDALGSSPEFIDALSHQVQGRVCQPGEGAQRPASMMLYARMIRLLPDLASEETFDCYFEHATNEDAVLWEGISAWQRSGYPKPAALEALERAAEKPQTRERLGNGAAFAQDMAPKEFELDERGFPLPGQLVTPAGTKLGLPPGSL